MSCFNPVDAWQPDDGTQLVFSEIRNARHIKVPCLNCIGCRVDRAGQWAMRLMHEKQLHPAASFITLTYNPKNLPPDGGLRKKHFQNFMKDLRKHLAAPYSKLKEDCTPDVYQRGKKAGLVKEGLSTVQPIKFYMCGEYGDTNLRPHYHAILYNLEFEDLIHLGQTKSGLPLYTSPTLEKIWGKGFVQVGEVTEESAAYIARYVIKKIVGEAADQINEETGLKPYERYNDYTGEIHEVWPEYSTMSRGGRFGRGIAHDWIHTYKNDVYPKDYTTVKGNKYKPPRYYDEALKEIDVDMFEDIKEGRKQLIAVLSGDNTPERLKARETVAKAKLKLLKREL